VIPSEVVIRSVTKLRVGLVTRTSMFSIVDMRGLSFIG